MSLLEQLLPCSYKKAVFLISSSSVDGGRKDQKHSFPNSDKQSIEDFGADPRSYSIQGWITNSSGEDDYLDRKKALLTALESSEKGELSHPLYGILKNMKVRTFSLTENMSDLGRGEISILFEIDDDLGAPIATQDTLSLVSVANDAVVSEVNKNTANSFKVDKRFISNFGYAREKLNEYVKAYEDATKTIVTITDNVDAFSSLVSDFGTEINNLIQTPQALADSMTSLGQTFNGLFATVDSQIFAWRELFGFGDKDLTSINITASNIEKESNNLVINKAVKAESLSYSYLAAVSVNYRTTNDLDLAGQDLENQYQSMIYDTDLGFDLREALLNMREVSNAYFVARRVTLQRIIAVRTPRLPARIIAYQYYGSSNLGNEIAELNNEANVSFVNGEIQIVTQ